MATTILLNIIKMKVGNGLLVGATFINLSKAFDTINHARILDKFLSCGIASKELNWMSGYLFSRNQFEQVDNYIVKLQPSYSGVPQKLVLLTY